MCGRFTLHADGESLQRQFDLTETPEIRARYNIAPTQPVAVITNAAPQTLTYQRWGLVPSWAKDTKGGARMINARAETLAVKPAFRAAFRRRRCLIPASGFYEWAKLDDGNKQAHYIHIDDHAPFAFAGLWETWADKDGGELQTCTIITTEPNDTLRPLHHRMAVILQPEDYALWLTADELPPEELTPLLQPYPPATMAAYPVSSLVNSPANDSPQLIEPHQPPQQLSLL